MKVVENMQFTFNPDISVKEGADDQGKWLQIGGTALAETVSRNKRKYTMENLKENDGRKFKWLFGHPEEEEEHIVGLGEFALEGNELKHMGKIRNTAKHPDVVEAVRDGFLGPSIHASAKKAVYDEKQGVYNIHGLEIEGVGLVAFQGVKKASIDYAIAESFKERTETKESSTEDAKDKDKEVIHMAEEDKKPEEQEQGKEPEAQPEPEPSKEETQESESLEEYKKKVDKVDEKLNQLAQAEKEKTVESILKVNKTLKKEDLMKESEDKLELIKQYEEKLASQNNESGIVEGDEEDGEEKKEVSESKDGSVSLTKEAYAAFNKDLRERVR